MTINEAYEEWDSLGTSRRFEIFCNIARFIMWKGDPESDAIYDFLAHYAMLEEDGDYFGTEGLKV